MELALSQAVPSSCHVARSSKACCRCRCRYHLENLARPQWVAAGGADARWIAAPWVFEAFWWVLPFPASLDSQWNATAAGCPGGCCPVARWSSWCFADASQMPDVPAWQRWQWFRVWLFCPRRCHRVGPDTCSDAHRATANCTQRFWPQRPRHMPACMSFLTARWCTRAFVLHCKPSLVSVFSDGTMMPASTAAAEDSCPFLLGNKNTLRRHREGDTSKGCARFLHVFVVCCVNTVGPVEVSI